MTTTNLSLPLIAASQAQKHVTHNEALNRLDVLVQTAVESAALAAPPGSPADGQVWIVAASPTGAWAGRARQLAVRQGNGWSFIQPKDGWQAWNKAATQQLVYRESLPGWQALGGGGGGGSGPPFSDADFAIRDDADPSKEARFQAAGIATATTRTFTLPNVSATLAHIGNAVQTFAGETYFAAPTVMVGTATATGTLALGNGATLNGATKTVQVGTGGVAGSTTNIEVGSATSGALGSLVIRSPTVTFAASVAAIDAAAANLSAARVGIGGAAADATNRLSVNSPATLLNHAGGSHEATVNKAAAVNDAAFAFKVGFSTRALFGLLGSDDFSLKVSPDGTSFFDAFIAARATGRVEFPAPILLPGLSAVPAAPPAGRIALYSRQRAGAGWPEVRRPNGRDFPLQPHFGLNRIGIWLPAQSTTISTVGFGVISVGTISTPALSTGALVNGTRRWRVTSAAVLDSVCDQRSPTTACWRGNAADQGGFTFVARVSLATLQATGMGFFGLLANTAALAVTSTVASLVSALGFGFQRGTDTNWQVLHNDASGVPTQLNTGMPVQTGDLHSLFLWAAPNGASVWARIVNEATGAVFEAELATDLPASTAFLTPRLFLNNGATAAAVAFDCNGVYLETDF